MKASTAIGIGVAIVGLLFGAMMEGSQISAFIDPPAILIVFGGTFGVTLAATSMESVKRIPSLYKKAMSTPHHELQGGGAGAGRAGRKSAPRRVAGARVGSRRPRRRVHPQRAAAGRRRH